MQAAVLLACTILAAIFGLAGVTHLATLSRTTVAMRGSGFPRPLAALVGIALPVVELAVAGALLTNTWVHWGALGAIVLSLMLIVGIAFRSARRRSSGAQVSGKVVATPSGGPGLAQAGTIAAISTFVLWQVWDDPGPSLLAWFGDLSTIESVSLGAGLLALVLVAAVAWFAVQLLQLNGRLLLRVEALESTHQSRERDKGTAKHLGDAAEAGPPIDENGQAAVTAPGMSGLGQPVPDVTLHTLSGETMRLPELRGARTLVIFWNPECRFCAKMLDALRLWEADPPQGAPRLLVISTGTLDANRQLTLRAPVLLDPTFVAGRAFGASGTPTAIVIDAEGRFASEVAVGAQAVLALAGFRATSAGSPA